MKRAMLVLAVLAAGCAASAPPTRPTPGNLTAPTDEVRDYGDPVARMRTLARDGTDAGVGRPHVQLRFAGGASTLAAALAAPPGPALGICDEAEFEVLAETDDAVRIAIVAPTAVVARWVPRANLRTVTMVATPWRRTIDETQPAWRLLAGAPLTLAPSAGDAALVPVQVETVDVRASGFVDRGVLGQVYLRATAGTPMLVDAAGHAPATRIGGCTDNDNSYLALVGPEVTLPAGTCLRDVASGGVVAVARAGLAAVIAASSTGAWSTANVVLDLAAFAHTLDVMIPDGGLASVVPGTVTATGAFVLDQETCDIPSP